MSGLEVRHLTLRYPDSQAAALQDVEFIAPAGALTALLGPSGCGKTTLLHAICGLQRPSSGRIIIGGVDVGDRPAERRPVGMVFQSGALFPHLSARGNVEYPLRAAGVDPAHARVRANEALDAVGLARIGARHPSELSGGEQQRVALARAIVQAPLVLLLDEPLGNVEPRLRRALREEIRALQQRLHITVVYVTHDQREALAVSDHVVLLAGGRVVEAGAPRALYESPATAFGAAFMGEATVLPGVREADGTVWLGALALPHRHPGGAGAVQVAARPEAWRLKHCSHPGLGGTVARRSYLGRAFEYLVETALGTVLVHAPAVGLGVEVGAPVTLQLGARGVWVIAREQLSNGFREEAVLPP